ncbi:MAG: helix-turn-helix domain-containing protein [Ignavibacteriales bacterium]|nr:helix-turn-helix domain-containing protein [Ignavibacteriales bacterium]
MQKPASKNKIDGLQIGADEFLAKPFSPRELEIRVSNLIRIRQLLREKYKEISVIKSEDVKASPIDKEFLDKVFGLIKNHLEDNQFSVQKLADEMAISVSQLNRKLNALINQSAGKLFRSAKLDYAAKLLEKMPVISLRLHIELALPMFQVLQTVSRKNSAFSHKNILRIYKRLLNNLCYAKQQTSEVSMNRFMKIFSI